MDFFEELRQRAMNEGVSPVLMKAVLNRLENSDVGKRLQFIVSINSHGPPLVAYAVEFVRFREEIIRGKNGNSDRVSAAWKRLIEKGFSQDLLMTFNKEILKATPSPVSISAARTPRRFPH